MFRVDGPISLLVLDMEVILSLVSAAVARRLGALNSLLPCPFLSFELFEGLLSLAIGVILLNLGRDHRLLLLRVVPIELGLLRGVFVLFRLLISVLLVEL